MSVDVQLLFMGVLIKNGSTTPPTWFSRDDSSFLGVAQYNLTFSVGYRDQKSISFHLLRSILPKMTLGCLTVAQDLKKSFLLVFLREFLDSQTFLNHKKMSRKLHFIFLAV